MKVMLPVIVPPALGKAASAVDWAAVTAVVSVESALSTYCFVAAWRLDDGLPSRVSFPVMVPPDRFR